MKTKLFVFALVLLAVLSLTPVLAQNAKIESILVFEGHEKTAISGEFSPDGSMIISAGGEYSPMKGGTKDVAGELLLWDSGTGEIIHRLEGHTGAVADAMFSPDGQMIVSGSWDGSLMLWDVATGEEIRSFEGDPDLEWVGVDFSPDSEVVVATSNSGEIALWDVETGEQIRKLKEGTVSDAVFSPDGKTILSGDWAGDVMLWDAETGEEIRSFEGLILWVLGVAFSPDGETAISTGGDTMVILWDVATGQPLQNFEGHTSYVNDVSISPDGQTAVTAGGDRYMIVWDMATGKEIERFEHPRDVLGVDISPDGQTALSTSLDGKVRLWPLAAQGRSSKGEGEFLAVVEAYVNAFATDVEAIPQYLTEDAVRHHLMGPDLENGELVEQFGVDEIMENATGFQATFPGVGFEVLYSVERDDYIWTISNSTELPDTDGAVLYIVLVARFSEGKIAEIWVAGDELAMLHLLDAYPETAD